MLIFIVPLRSPKTCSNWHDVSQLCNSTLNSITRQTSPNFKVILCCNERPLNFQEHEKILVVEEDFPIPQSWDEGIGDIYRKIKRSMVEARQFGSSFVMRVDADDLVSQRLVEYTDRYPHADGWYLRWGYMYPQGENYIYLRPRFTTISGSSNILKCEASEYPSSIDTPSAEWLEPVWQHLNINKCLIPYNKKVEPLPFPAVVFRTHANNMSGSDLKKDRFSSWKNVLLNKIFYRKLSLSIRNEFSI